MHWSKFVSYVIYIYLYITMAYTCLLTINNVSFHCCVTSDNCFFMKYRVDWLDPNSHVGTPLLKIYCTEVKTFWDLSLLECSIIHMALAKTLNLKVFFFLLRWTWLYGIIDVWGLCKLESMGRSSTGLCCRLMNAWRCLWCWKLLVRNCASFSLIWVYSIFLSLYILYSGINLIINVPTSNL